MNPIDLIVTVCAVLSPATCEETHLAFSGSGRRIWLFPGAVRCSSALWVRHPISPSGLASIRNGMWSGGAANIRAAMTRQMRAEQRPQADAMSGPATTGCWLFIAVLQILVGDREHRIGLDLDIPHNAFL